MAPMAHDTDRGHALRGFAGFSVEKLRETSSKGGRTAHERGVAHEWDHESGKAAGRKGGLATKAKREGANNGSDRDACVDDHAIEAEPGEAGDGQA